MSTAKNEHSKTEKKTADNTKADHSEKSHEPAKQHASPAKKESANHKSEAKHEPGHTQGAVKDPAHDGRLKENREKGAHKGD